MDYLRDSIESATYALSVLDEAVSYAYIRHVNFYSNSMGSRDFMAKDKLEQAFYQTLVHFPPFLGDITQTSTNRLQVVVDKDNLNIPKYLESQSGVHFSDIESAGYHQDTWPRNLATAGKIPSPDPATGRIKLIDIHVMRLKENSGVIISTAFAHVITDGYGCFEFLNRWADEARALISGEPAEQIAYCFDRAVVHRHLPEENVPVKKEVSDMYLGDSWTSRFLTWLSPETRGKIMSYLDSMAPMEGCLFRLPREKLNGLRDQVLQYVPEGTRVSDNDLVSALTYKLLTQATTEATGEDPGWLAKLASRAMGIKNEHMLGFPCDIRFRINMQSENYIGNPLYQASFANSIDFAKQPSNAQTLAEVAVQVREAISQVTPARIGGFYSMIESKDAKLGGFLAGMMAYKMVNGVSNQTRFNIYKADFGSGVQSFATAKPDFGDGVIIILPPPPPSNDLLVNLTVTAKVKECILKNKFWMELAEVVY